MTKGNIQENEPGSTWSLYRELALEEVVDLDYMMWTASSTETSVTDYHATKQHIREEGNLQHCVCTSKACSIIHQYLIPVTYCATYLVCAQPFTPHTKHTYVVGINIKTEIKFKMSIQYLLQNMMSIACVENGLSYFKNSVFQHSVLNRWIIMTCWYFRGNYFAFQIKMHAGELV
jgi:hypothetical protein